MAPLALTLPMLAVAAFGDCGFKLINVDATGIEIEPDYYAASVSDDGRYATFASDPGVFGPVHVQLKDFVTGTLIQIALARDPKISRDGRFLVFESDEQLVPGDNNNLWDIFVYEIATANITRVNKASVGGPANSHSFESTISADGRYVAFRSWATNLVPGDTNGRDDMFVRDRVAKTTVIASVGTAGQLGNKPAMLKPSISDNGRFVLFLSEATNLVSGDTNGIPDVFLRDLVLDTTERVNVSSTGEQANSLTPRAPSLSADGSLVVFDCLADNLVPRDRNGVRDVFLRDVVAGVTERVSVDTGGVERRFGGSDGVISPDGRLAAFVSGVESSTPHWVNVFIHDRQLVTTTVLTVDSDEPPNTSSSHAYLSIGGRYACFRTFTTHLAGNTETPAFVLTGCAFP